MDLNEIYRDLKATIDDIDEKLDSLEDPSTSGRRKLINEAIGNTEHIWQSIVASLSQQLNTNDLDDSMKVGIYYGITRGMTKEFDDFAKEVVSKIVENQPKVEPLITPEQAAELSALRPDLYGKIKQVVDLAQQFGDADGMEMPRRRTGAKGPRGKRKASYITWSIDGAEVNGAVGTLKPIQELYPQYEKVSDVTAAMKKAGINLTEPDAEDNVLKFELPDGRVLTGDYNPPVNAEEDESEDENADEEENEETE